jgi:hypothetical protein
MKPKNNERMTQEQLWIIAWFMAVSAAFLFGIAFALGDFPTYIYRTVIAFGLASSACSIGVFWTVAVRSEL